MAGKVYLVRIDGLVDNDYGVDLYLLGVYDTRDKAEEAVKTLPDEIKSAPDAEYVKIVECDLNKTLEVEKSFWGYETDVYLGGYME